MKMNILDFTGIRNIDDLNGILKAKGCTTVFLKKLSKNNNDKNQVYIHRNPDLLNSIFDLSFELRERSSSQKKRADRKQIISAVFKSFAWIAKDLEVHTVSDCKGILYTQYPEVRLSGFQSTSGLMPSSMSISFTKESPHISRYLALGATTEGKAFAVMVVSPDAEFEEEYTQLTYHPDSKICKFYHLQQSESNSEKLKVLLAQRIMGRSIKGCRLKPDGTSVPFTGTQVHGYTLEHELGIQTNADKNGDIYGIELKCFTNSKLTLFTPEPDGGLYHQDFEAFMRRYGYEKEAVYRFTGLHRAGKINEKSHLRLAILCSDKNSTDDSLRDYDLKRPFIDQLKNLHIILMDENNENAASWSITRLFNNWGVKHNEVVYVPASVKNSTQKEDLELGFSKIVIFGRHVLWCKKSSIEVMIKAIASGIIFLDPAPKFDPDDAKNNKRRSQWRINNIYRDAEFLYESVEIITF